LLYPAPEEAINPAYATIVAPFDSEAAAVTYAEKNKGDGMFEVFVMASPNAEPGAKPDLDFGLLASLIDSFDGQNSYGELADELDGLVQEGVSSHFLDTADFDTEEKLQFLSEEVPDRLAVFLKKIGLHDLKPSSKPPDRTLNGFDFWFTRRRYGTATFTWVEYRKHGDTAKVSAGDPYQKITPSQKDLKELIDRKKS
jgi:hypothetical protein